ncbi:cytosine permease [Dehalogenimonas sp. 4OHTPN]|uniref:Cytosine permease n=1 Tax=Dehalogenimonas sp. 4OHTPN TaxID=3166643 RepID=A0AAU8GBG0_9CHLR
MTSYPTEYNNYQPMFWQAAFSAVIGVAMMIALGAWALSTVRKALKGEDVEFPL